MDSDYGVLVVISGPSGSGKTTLMRALLASESRFQVLRSQTTRAPRSSDIPGEFDYLSNDELDLLGAQGKLLTVMKIHGVRHSTLKEAFQRVVKLGGAGAWFIMSCTVERTIEFRRELEKIGLAHILCPIFVRAPETETLRRRLIARGEATEIVERRLVECADWEKSARETEMYSFVENTEHGSGSVESAVKKVKEIIDFHFQAKKA
jgi:guanylate kinase